MYLHTRSLPDALPYFGRGADAVSAAIEQTRGFLTTMIDEVGSVQARGGTLKEAFEATHAALSPQFGKWPIFEHCLPFDVARLWEELSGTDWPSIDRKSTRLNSSH